MVLCLFIGFFPSETKFYIKQLCSYSDSFLDVYIYMCVYQGGKRKTEMEQKSGSEEKEASNIIMVTTTKK